MEDRARLLDWPREPEVYALLSSDADRWYSGEHFHTSLNRAELAERGLAAILEGWLPAEPLIREDTRVLALGSCFAASFVLWLGDHGFNRRAATSPYDMLVRSGAGFENVWVIEQQFRWAFGELDPSQVLWVDRGKQIVDATEERRQQVRRGLLESDVLIVTLGLSDLWYDRVANEPLWRTVPASLFDPERHTFKALTAAETSAHLAAIERLRSAYVPNLKIVFTVSPVQLRATYRAMSALVANTVSKATLRSGLDEFFRANPEKLNRELFYFPSYEIVKELFRDPYEADQRHVRPDVVATVLDAFARGYTSLPSNDLPQGLDPDEELRRQVLEVEERNRELQRAADERLKVIEELKRAADERLALVEELQRVCEERLALIEQLSAR